MTPSGESLVWLHGDVKTPPFSEAARIECGILLRRLERGESIGLPSSRPMPRIGRRCHELRVIDEKVAWRIIYRIDTDAIVISEVFSKKTPETPENPDAVIKMCKKRYSDYDSL
jgi:phage-related protein